MRIMLVCALATATPAPAAAETIALDGFVTVNRQCRQATPPQLKIIAPPRYGTITMRYTRVMPDFAPGSIFYHCNSKVRRGSGIFYTRAAAAAEADHFTIRVRYSNGETKLQHYIVPATNIRMFGRREEHIRAGR